MAKRVLVIGSGGREHAICWKLAKSSQVETVYAAPGNPGMAEVGECVSIQADEIEKLVSFAKENAIDLTVVGPEYPLTLGIVDAFRAVGLRVFGPTKEAASLEGSKAFAKEIMDAAGVKNAEYKTFEAEAEALQYLESRGAPIVVKADGLAAGKGVFVCETLAQAQGAVREVFGAFSSAKVVVEDFIEGVEASYIVATNGKHIVPLASSHDYKRIFDGDEGPNTGGMGAVSPTSRLDGFDDEVIIQEVMRPIITEMEKRGTPFQGFLYAGLMISPAGEVQVLEFNARLGDPETQAILRRLESDFYELLYVLSDPGGAEPPAQNWSSDSAICVVLASEGYPASASKGDSISGIDVAKTLKGVEVFHAGTGQAEELVTAGGRVLGVTAVASTQDEARSHAFDAVESIKYRGKQYREDIGRV